jgi:hypothetical protein
MIRQFLHLRGNGSAPSWFESVLFVALTSGPPKFRDRDVTASPTGAIEAFVLVQVAVWAVGGLWVLARLFTLVLRRGLLPPVNPLQVLGVLLLVSLSLSRCSWAAGW